MRYKSNGEINVFFLFLFSSLIFEQATIHQSINDILLEDEYFHSIDRNWYDDHFDNDRQ